MTFEELAFVNDTWEDEGYIRIHYGLDSRYDFVALDKALCDENIANQVVRKFKGKDVYLEYSEKTILDLVTLGKTALDEAGWKRMLALFESYVAYYENVPHPHSAEEESLWMECKEDISNIKNKVFQTGQQKERSSDRNEREGRENALRALDMAFKALEECRAAVEKQKPKKTD